GGDPARAVHPPDEHEHPRGPRAGGPRDHRDREGDRAVSDDRERLLSEIFDAVAVASPVQFTVAGVPFSVTGGAAALAAAYGVSPPAATESRAGQGSGAGQCPLVGFLSTVLYANCYCRPFRGRIDPPPAPGAPQVAPDSEFISTLSEANRSREWWERGW